MVTQQQNYEFYLRPSTADLKQISEQLSGVPRESIERQIIPDSELDVIHGVGIIKGEQGLVAVINGFSVLEDFGVPVLRYDDRVYKYDPDLKRNDRDTLVFAPSDYPVFIDWGYFLLDLKQDFSDEGIKEMLKETLAMQRFLRPVQNS